MVIIQIKSELNLCLLMKIFVQMSFSSIESQSRNLICYIPAFPTGPSLDLPLDTQTFIKCVLAQIISSALIILTIIHIREMGLKKLC